MRPSVAQAAFIALFVAGCGAGEGALSTPAAEAPTETPSTTAPDPRPATPEVLSGPLDPSVVAALERLVEVSPYTVEPDVVDVIGASGDARLAWVLADVMRFSVIGTDRLLDAFTRLTGATVEGAVPWVDATDLLLAWDLPAPPGYAGLKRRLLSTVDPRWERLLADPHDIDERHLAWGGVLVDDRPPGDPDPCDRSCIPALDDPGVTDAAGGSWYPDGWIVFGVVVDGEARAYPRPIMEVHELVNDTLGGRRIGLPYCTLCGSADGFLVDRIPGFDDLVLRTSGLLVRSNKVMFDLRTWSAFDTFTGRAVSGPLRETGLRLERITVVTTTWGDWKAAHPDTTIVAEDGGIGRVYAGDPLGGRDLRGPIFPVGERDARLPAQEQVLGVVLEDGTPIAFPAAAARAALAAGSDVMLGGVVVRLSGGGLVAEASGEPIASKQAFWFAWSQFHPTTLLWQG
jgi:hypothetical protein